MFRSKERCAQFMQDLADPFICEGDRPLFFDLMRKPLAVPEIKGESQGPWAFLNPAEDLALLLHGQAWLTTGTPSNGEKPLESLPIEEPHKAGHRLPATANLFGDLLSQHPSGDPKDSLQTFSDSAVGFSFKKPLQASNIHLAGKDGLLGHSSPPFKGEGYHS